MVGLAILASCATSPGPTRPDPWRGVLSRARQALQAGRWRDAIQLADTVPQESSLEKEAVALRSLARRTALEGGEGIVASLEAFPPRLRAEDEPEIYLVLRNLSGEAAQLDLGGQRGWLSLHSRSEDPPLLRLQIVRTSWTGRETRLRDRWERWLSLEDLSLISPQLRLAPWSTWRVRLTPRLERGGGFLLQRFLLSGRVTAKRLSWGGDAIPLPGIEASPTELRFYPRGFRTLEENPLASLRRALDLPGAGAHVFIAATMLEGQDVARGRALLLERNRREDPNDETHTTVRAALDWLGVHRGRQAAFEQWLRRARKESALRGSDASQRSGGSGSSRGRREG